MYGMDYGHILKKDDDDDDLVKNTEVHSHKSSTYYEKIIKLQKDSQGTEKCIRPICLKNFIVTYNIRKL